MCPGNPKNIRAAGPLSVAMGTARMVRRYSSGQDTAYINDMSQGSLKAEEKPNVFCLPTML